MDKPVNLKRAALLPHGLVLYKSLARDDTIRALQELLESLVSAEPAALLVFQTYHRFCTLAQEHHWPEHILDLILDDDNIFCRQASAATPEQLDPAISTLAARDLAILQELAAITPRHIQEAAADVFEGLDLFTTGGGDPLAIENWPVWEVMPSGIDSTPAAGLNINRQSFPEQASAPRINPGHTPAAGSGDSTGASAAAAWLSSCRQEAKGVLLCSPDWSASVNELARYYHQVGCGVFSRCTAFRWHKQPGSKGTLAGIAAPDPVQLDQLIGLEREKAQIQENTEHFLAGFPANNIILYGDRGTGKSSTVKALLNAYASRGLRLVEMAKADLGDFPLLMRQLAAQRHKFIIFVDDLSFDETESGYRELKTILEGGLAVRPQNVLIYATSNRRHLVKESFAERQGDEVHVRDSMEEKLSLADRFGITVTFPAPDQAGYLQIVEGLAEQRGLAVDRDELRQLALHWEMWHNGRSGRTARQFIDYLAARTAAR